MPQLDHPVIPIRSFNNKYIYGVGAKDPDWLDYSFCRGLGEFSAHAQIAFEKHLKEIKQYVIKRVSAF